VISKMGSGDGQENAEILNKREIPKKVDEK